MATPAVADRASSHALIGLALILLATCVVYLPARNGGRIWDDVDNLTKPELQPISGLSRIWLDPRSTAQYYPLVHTAFWIEHKLWGDSLLGYHLVNVLWHLLSVVLVYSILKKLKIPGPLLATAIFALHPVMVESVAWITEQKNTLSTLFYLGSVRVYLNFDQSRIPRQYLAAVGLFALALATKTAVVTLPVALLVILWWQRGKLSLKQDIVPLVPFFLLSVAAGLVTMYVEHEIIGAKGSAFELSLLQRFLLAGRVVWFYLATLVWPANLSFVYPRWTIDPAQWWQWLFSLAAIMTTIVLWMVRDRSRGPLAAWLFFCATLFPVMGFLNIYFFMYSYVADHFQYLASLGPIVLAAAGLTRGAAHFPQMSKSLSTGLCVVLIGILAVLTWQQSQTYADSNTLYLATIKRNPECWMAHYNLAWELANSGRPQEAIEHYRSVLVLKPDYFEAHNNLGRLYRDTGQLTEAINELQAALALRPDNASILNVLGDALMHTGHLPEAIDRIEHALRIEPNDSEAHNNMGVALVQSNQVPRAIEHFRRAIEINPDDRKAHANLGKTLMNAGNDQEATVELQRALELQPNRADLHNCLGGILAKNGQANGAIQHFQTALRLDPKLVETYINLALAFALANRSEEAIAIAQQGIEVARSTGQGEAAQTAQEWLTRYRTELNAAGRKSP